MCWKREQEFDLSKKRTNRSFSFSGSPLPRPMMQKRWFVAVRLVDEHVFWGASFSLHHLHTHCLNCSSFLIAPAGCTIWHISLFGWHNYYSIMLIIAGDKNKMPVLGTFHLWAHPSLVCSSFLSHSSFYSVVDSCWFTRDLSTSTRCAWG